MAATMVEKNAVKQITKTGHTLSFELLCYVFAFNPNLGNFIPSPQNDMTRKYNVILLKLLLTNILPLTPEN